MNQMYIDELLVVYGSFFAMLLWGAVLMYFCYGIELHRSTFGSLIGENVSGLRSVMEVKMCEWFWALVLAALILGAIRLAGEWRNL